MRLLHGLNITAAENKGEFGVSLYVSGMPQPTRNYRIYVDPMDREVFSGKWGISQNAMRRLSGFK